MIRAIALIALASPALADHAPEHHLAQARCAPVAAMIEGLAKEYGEHPRFIGLDQQQLITVLYLNPNTGTWTVLVVRPDGSACVADEGTNGELRDAPTEGIDG